MKPVALGLAAVMTIMSVGNVTYAVNPADTLQDQGSAPPPHQNYCNSEHI